MSDLKDSNKYIFNMYIRYYKVQKLWNLKTSLAEPGALAHRLQNPKWPPGAPKWQRGSGKVPTPRFLGVLSNFR